MYEEEGVYIGAVGARFERADQMETLQMVIDGERTTESAGYGARGLDTPLRRRLAPFAKLYGCGGANGASYFPSSAEVRAAAAAAGSLAAAGFVELRTGRLLNLSVFAKRSVLNIYLIPIRMSIYHAIVSIRVTIDTMLGDAEYRSNAANKAGFVYLVGLGLGLTTYNTVVSPFHFISVVVCLYNH
jgi:hypothetical protein